MGQALAALLRGRLRECGGGSCSSSPCGPLPLSPEEEEEEEFLSRSSFGRPSPSPSPPGGKTRPSSFLAMFFVVERREKGENGLNGRRAGQGRRGSGAGERRGGTSAQAHKHKREGNPQYLYNQKKGGKKLCSGRYGPIPFDLWNGNVEEKSRRTNLRREGYDLRV